VAGGEEKWAGVRKRVRRVRKRVGGALRCWWKISCGVGVEGTDSGALCAAARWASATGGFLEEVAHG
jgi:hypothetical protein